MIEEWKDIIGYEGVYQVSNFGNIKSLDRLIFNKGKQTYQKLKGKNIKHCKNGKGYMLVNLCKCGNTLSFMVHKIVASTFFNYVNFDSSLVIDHIDNDKNNNKLSNLQIITSRENSSKDRNPKSGVTGVSIRKRLKPYMSTININGINKYIGSYFTMQEANSAYQSQLKSISK